MTLYRVWFQSRQDGRLIAGFDYRSLKFGLKLTTNPDRAVSLITDLEDPQVVEMRLYQAVIRRPTKKSQELPYTDTLDAYATVHRNFELLMRPAEEQEIFQPGTTYVVGDAWVDIDKFGAHRQFIKFNNRFVEFSKRQDKRTFDVLGAGYFVDGKRGTFYPGMTVKSSEGPEFWALPKEFKKWPKLINRRATLPSRVTVGRLANGSMYSRVEDRLRA